MAVRDIFLNNAGLKLMALFLACLIWLMIRFVILDQMQGIPNPFVNLETREFQVPVHVKTQASDSRRFKLHHHQVTVTATDSAQRLDELSADSFEVILDLTQVGDLGQFTQSLEVDHPDDGLRVELKPSEIQVWTDADAEPAPSGAPDPRSPSEEDSVPDEPRVDEIR